MVHRTLGTKMVAKFNEYSVLTPWWPEQLKQWRGRWLIRVVRSPVCELLAQGAKTIENMTIPEWISWGCQGFIVTGIYQACAKLTANDMQRYVPADYHNLQHNKKNNGKIMAIIILGPVDSPNRPGDRGWFSDTAVNGSNASMHRVIARWKLTHPITPHRKYGLQGAFMLMTPQDMHKCCVMMARHILRSPDVPLFDGIIPPPHAMNSDIHGELKKLTAKKIPDMPIEKEDSFPAHDGFLSGHHTLQQGFVFRNSKSNAVSTALELLKYKPADNAGFHPEWPGPLTVIEGGYKVDFNKLPDPIPEFIHLKSGHIQVTLRLMNIILHDNDQFPHATKRSSLSRGKSRAKDYDANTLMYALKYIQTVDAALSHGDDKTWVLPLHDDWAHLPFVCPNHLTRLRNTNSHIDRVVPFRAYPKSSDLRQEIDPECVCSKVAAWEEFKTMTPYALAGPFFKSNVEFMAERLHDKMQGTVDLSRYSYVVSDLQPQEGDEGDEVDEGDECEEDESEYEALVADQLDKEKKLVQAHNEWKAACQRLLDWKQRK